MKEIDEVIVNLCNDINTAINNNNVTEFTLDEIKALAELISARAM